MLVGTFAALGCLVYFILPIRVRMLIAFIVMTKGFDLLPPDFYGVDSWDLGAVLFLLSALPLLFAKAAAPRDTPIYLTLWKALYLWMLVCLAWSLLGYRYPWLNTLKVARQMVIGYLSLFVLLRLFVSEERSLQFFLRWLYLISFAILPVCIVQNFFKLQIMYGLYRDYGSVTRSLPVFLPIAMFFLWSIAARFISAGRIKIHEAVYAAMVLVVTATTYTRGIYLSVLAVLALLVLNLLYDRRLSLLRLNAAALLGVLFVSALALAGYLDSVLDRFSSGVQLLSLSEKFADRSKRNVDSFTGRLALTKERFGLVEEHNPFLGLGFIHEEDVPPALKNALKYGSAIMTPDYVKRYRFGYPYRIALYSADIGWANLVLMTGFVGVALFLTFLGAFFLSYYRKGELPDALYAQRLAFFLQTVMMALLMFNGDTFVSKLQVACFMIAGYAVTSCQGKPEAGPPGGALPARGVPSGALPAGRMVTL